MIRLYPDYFRLYRIYTQLTLINFYTSRINDAIETSLTSIELIKKNAPQDYEALGWIYNNLAAAYYKLGNFKKSKEIWLLAEKVWIEGLGEQHVTLGSLYQNLGSITNAISNDNEGYNEAIEYLKKSLKIYRHQYSDAHPYVMNVFSNIAGIYWQMGLKDKALHYYELFAINYDFDSSDHALLPNVGNYISALIDTGRILDANKWYEKTANSLEKRNMDDSLLFEAMNSYIEYYLGKQELQRAQQWAQQRYAKTAAYVLSLKDLALITNFFSSWVQAEYLRINLLLYKLLGESKRLSEQQEQLDLVLNTINLFNRSNISNDSNELSSAKLRQYQQLLAKKTRVLQSFSSDDIDETLAEKLNNELKNITIELTALKEIFQSDFTPNITLKTITEHLLEDETIIWFKGYDEELFTLTISNSGAQIYHDSNIKSQLIQQKTEHLQSLLTQENAIYSFELQQYDHQAAKELHDLFFGNLPQLPKKITILQSPISDLLPTAALVSKLSDDGIGHRYFIEDHDISYAPSFSNIINRKSKSGVEEYSLAIGAPLLSEDLQGKRSVSKLHLTDNPEQNILLVKNLPSLPSSKDELSFFKKNVPHSKVLLGANATKSNFIDALSKPLDIVSFVSHALTVEHTTGKLTSAIILTPDEKNAETDNGLLTTEDIESLNINANLVVLSACNTGKSEDGIMFDYSGLATSFALAGSQNVLVSTAAVNDTSTSLLMQKFYENSQSTDYENILAEAMRKMINTSDYKHPYYWANFRLLKIR